MLKNAKETMKKLSVTSKRAHPFPKHLTCLKGFGQIPNYVNSCHGGNALTAFKGFTECQIPDPEGFSKENG